MSAARRLSLPLAGLLVVLAIAPWQAGGSPTPTAPELFWGVAPQQIPGPPDFQRMKTGGVDSVRYPLFWDSTEKRRGKYDWSAFDFFVRGAALAGLEVLPVVLATPRWLAKDPRILPVQNRRQKRAWQRFLRAAARRYGPTGRFWELHSVSDADPVPYRPIRVWQLLNEVNFFYFAKPISPSQYGKVAKLGHAALRGVDRGAKVVLSGLFAAPREGPPKALPGVTFLRRLYKVRKIKAAFEYASLHPYATDASQLPSRIKALRSVMRRHGDGHTGLYLTEIGWGSGTDTAFEKGEQGQVDELSEAFTLFLQRQRAWHIARVYWFSWMDRLGTCNFCDSVGLFRTDGTPKPAWYRYVEFAGGTP